MYIRGEDGKQYPKPTAQNTKQKHPLIQMAIEKIEKELWVNEETGEIVLGQGQLQPHQLNQKVGTIPPDTNNEKIDEKMDKILDLLKTKNVYGEPENSITAEIDLKAVDIDVKKQIAIDKVSTDKLESEEYKNTQSSNKLSKLRELRRGN
jgi:hypothetical protein